MREGQDTDRMQAERPDVTPEPSPTPEPLLTVAHATRRGPEAGPGAMRTN